MNKNKRRNKMGQENSAPTIEEYWEYAILEEDRDRKIHNHVERERQHYQKAWDIYVDEDQW